MKKEKKVENLTEEGETQKKKRKMEEKRSRREAVIISEDLKEVLKKDSEYISNNRQYDLPRDKTVSKILSEFEKSEKDEDDVTKYFVQGLKSYFNASVGKLCLYKSERNQYLEEIEKNNKLPVEQYGLEHLLRFLTKLSKLLETNMDSITQEQVKKKAKDLEKFIEKTLN